MVPKNTELEVHDRNVPWTENVDLVARHSSQKCRTRNPIQAVGVTAVASWQLVVVVEVVVVVVVSVVVVSGL